VQHWLGGQNCLQKSTQNVAQQIYICQKYCITFFSKKEVKNCNTNALFQTKMTNRPNGENSSSLVALISCRKLEWESSESTERRQVALIVFFQSSFYFRPSIIPAARLLLILNWRQFHFKRFSNEESRKGSQVNREHFLNQNLPRQKNSATPRSVFEDRTMYMYICIHVHMYTCTYV
jgi:hypothetical protein